jgi:tetratricopeptide (TPR) repeat protein
LNKKRPRPQKLSPGEQTLLAEAQRLFDDGRLSPASLCCDQLIAAKPRAVEPRLLKSWIHLRSGDFFVAQMAVEKAASLLPADAGVQAWAAEVCSEAGDLCAGDQFRAQAIKLKSRDPSVLASMAASLTNEERYEDALVYYRQLLKLKPGDSALRLNVAYSARYTGDIDLAESELRTLLRQNPSFHQAQFALSQLRRATAENNYIDGFEQSLAANKDDPDAEIFLGYALGKSYEDLGDYDRAFEHYSHGARWQKRSRVHRGGEAAAARQVYACFRDLPPPQSGDRGAGMIFVIGLPRTGTTLLDRMLGSHSRVENAGELRTFPFSVHRQLGLKVRGIMAPELPTSLAKLDYSNLGKEYLACLPQWMWQSGSLTDKNPMNYLYAGIIARALPGAKIVHIRRNPMDACFSNFKQLFASGAYMHSYDLQELGDYYSAYSCLMQLWRETLNERFIELRYEDLVADSESQLRQILLACELDWESGVLDFHRRSSSIGTASFAQASQPLYTTSVDKWRHFESHLQPLEQALVKAGVLV